jgi:hypothetical protein
MLDFTGNRGKTAGAWNAPKHSMLPHSIRDTHTDLEPETLRRMDERDRNDDARESTRIMTEKHGGKSSVYGVVKPRVVPSPFPTPTRPPFQVRPPMPSEPTWLRPSQNLKLPPVPVNEPAQQFSDFDFSEFEESPNTRASFGFEDEEEPSDQVPVVHYRFRTIAERLANPITPEDAQLCWDHAQMLADAQQPEHWATNYLPLESGVQPVTVAPAARSLAASPRRVSYARAGAGFLLAVVLGAAAVASWRGELTEANVRYVGMEAQITAQNVLNHTSTVSRTRLTHWK